MVTGKLIGSAEWTGPEIVSTITIDAAQRHRATGGRATGNSTAATRVSRHRRISNIAVRHPYSPIIVTEPAFFPHEQPICRLDTVATTRMMSQWKVAGSVRNLCAAARESTGPHGSGISVTKWTQCVFTLPANLWERVRPAPSAGGPIDPDRGSLVAEQRQSEDRATFSDVHADRSGGAWVGRWWSYP